MCHHCFNVQDLLLKSDVRHQSVFVSANIEDGEISDPIDGVEYLFKLSPRHEVVLLNHAPPSLEGDICLRVSQSKFAQRFVADYLHVLIISQNEINARTLRLCQRLHFRNIPREDQAELIDIANCPSALTASIAASICVNSPPNPVSGSTLSFGSITLPTATVAAFAAARSVSVDRCATAVWFLPACQCDMSMLCESRAWCSTRTSVKLSGAGR